MAVGLKALCPVLVGRERELSALEDALLRALRGAGSVVVIGGEAGLGKTRLTTELSHRAETLGATVMTGACSEAEVSLPYLPFLEAIGNHLGRTDLGAINAALGPAAADLAQLFPQLGAGPGPGGDATQSKLRLFEAILMLLRAAGGASGLLLILEDLHWADPATRELLDYMTRRLRSTNVLVAATYRTEELHRKHALLPTIQGWRRSGQVEVVEVHPLTEAAVGDMLCAIFDQAEVSTEFQQFLLARTEGNPFVVEEMLKEAIDRQDIYPTDEGWDRKELAELRLPPSVRDGILLRVERLGEADAQVLSAASVVGRSFDVPMLVAVTRVDEEAVVTSLQRCIQHQLLEEDAQSSASYRFRHALTREAIYEDMVTPRRQQLHGRVVDVLAARGRPAAELAHHLLLAGRNEEAVRMCREAAESAIKAVAYRDAADLLERALPHARNDLEKGRLLCQAADAHWYNIQPGVARKLLQEGIPLLEAAGDVAGAAANRILLGRCFWELQRTDLAQQEFETALRALEPLGPSEALATALIRLAGIFIFNARAEEALQYCQRAEAVAREANSDRALAWAWIFTSLPLMALGRFAEGIEAVTRGYELSIDRGYWFQAGNAMFNSCWLSLHLGLGRQAAEWIERARLEIPAGSVDSWIGYQQGLLALHSGRLAAGLQVIRETQHINEEAGQEKTAWRCRVAHAQILAELDRGQEAAAVLPPIETRVDSQDAIYDTAARVRTALALRRPEEALAAARTVDPAHCPGASPCDAVAQAAMTLDPELVVSFVGGLPVAGDTLATPRYLAARGAAAIISGDTTGATDDLRRAIQILREGELLLDAWHMSQLLARAHHAAGEPGAAEAVLASVVTEAEDAGAGLAARLAREVASELGLQLPPPRLREPAAPGGEVAPDSHRLAGERLVTVLFADVRGYTARSAGTPPVDLVDAMAALHRWASEEVRRNHGVVDKFAGDAVMATFNTSGASIDHARHALECGLALVEKASLAGLGVGVGIATGPAVVGHLTQGGNLSVIGQATNLAARLQAQSSAGEITVSEETEKRLGTKAGAAAAERLELELKGFEGPVTAYRHRAARRD